MLIKTKQGFTLLELLVTISIIGIISAMLLANFNAARDRARDAERKADLRNIQTALGMYYNDYGFYPANGATGTIIACGSQSSPTTCAWGLEWRADSKLLMSTLPKDPLSSQSYIYTRIDLDTYTLQACLENKSDDKGIASDLCTASKWMFQVKP